MNSKRKVTVLNIVAILALALTVVTATYAYFQAQTGEGSQTDIKINANTVDTFTFATGNPISFTLDQNNFASGKGNITGSTFASATLTANNKTNTATNNYNLHLNISDNNFGYTQSTSYPEILLTVKDASNNEITSINGLEYKTVTDGKGTTIKGFDITTKTGLITLLNNREITTTGTKTDTWNITTTFVNYNADQSKNAGKSFSGQVLISKDSFDNYKPNTINTLSATKSGTNLTVNLNVEQGSNEIDKYYYAIKQKDSVAVLDTGITKLSNILADSSLVYKESTSNSYTFTEITDNSEYEIYAYAIDKKKVKTNTYSYNFSTTSYVLPSITIVTTSSTSNSVTVDVTASKGTNNISKYYYSIDNGNTFIESTSNSYKFTNLLKETNYRVIIKVMDSNKKYSNVYVINVQTLGALTLANYVIKQYNGVQGNNNIYYHNASLANGAGDNSYRYAGASSATNNYVCFGSYEEICPEDNLYRIIGVFGKNVKLIKATAASSELLGTNGAYVTDTTYKWSSLTACPSDTEAYVKNKEVPKIANRSLIGMPDPGAETCSKWQYSDLNKINLNTNFLNSLVIDWSSKIISWAWKIGKNTSNLNGLPINAFQTEMSSLRENYNAKIGMLYVSDYYYAASQTYWKYPGYSSRGALSDYRAATSANWLYVGQGTITISSADDEFYIYTTSFYGSVVSNLSDTSAIILPTFYLNSSVTYISGTGTSNSPIRIN